MQNSYITESNNDSIATHVQASPEHVPEMQNNNGKLTENTLLTPNNSQAYFADEKIHIPETDNVIHFIRYSLKD